MANEITATGIDKIAELRIMTNYIAGILDCRKALKESSGDIDQAILWLENNNILEAKKNDDEFLSWLMESEPSDPPPPAGFSYIRGKAQLYLKVGADNYRKRDFFNMPLSAWDAEALERIRLGFEQIVDYKGYTPDEPLRGLGISGFTDMIQTLHFELISRSSTEFDGNFLDKMLLQHIVSKDMDITLYNLV